MLRDSRDIIRRLLDDGFEEKSVRASHHKFVHRRLRHMVLVPHPKRDLPIARCTPFSGMQVGRRTDRDGPLIALIHKDTDSNYGASFPDVPGVITAGDTIDLLDSLHIKDAVICGLSMGGYTVFAMFRHAATYFRGMVLADTRSQGDSPEAVTNRKNMQQLALEKGPEAIADALVPKLLCEATLKGNGRNDALNPPWMASIVLALEDGFRLHRLIDPETTPADSFLRAITDLRRRTGLAPE